MAADAVVVVLYLFGVRQCVVGVFIMLIVACAGPGAQNGQQDAAPADALVVDGTPSVGDSALPDASLVDAEVGLDAPTDAPHDAAPLDAPPDASIDAAPVDAPSDAPTGPQLKIVSVPSRILTDVGQIGSATILVENEGTATASLTCSITDRPAFGVGCGSIPPGQTVEIPVSYLPYATGDRTAEVTLAVQGTAIVETVAVSGAAYTRVVLDALNNSVIVAGAEFHCTSFNTCSWRFVESATFTATAPAGMRFVAWNDPTCGTSPICVVSPEATGRNLRASFAPEENSTLDVVLSGSALGGVMVQVSSFEHPYVAVYCATSCEVPVPPGATVRARANGAVGEVTLSGACTGTDTCELTTVQGTQTITATWVTDSRERWARVLDTSAIQSVAFDSHGNVLVSTANYDGTRVWTIKLDPTGRTLWAHPRVGTVQIGPNDDVIVGGGLFLDANGYLKYVDGFQYVTPLPLGDLLHFRRQYSMNPNGFLAGAGRNNGLANFESFRLPLYERWHVSVTGESLQSVAVGPGAIFYMAVANALGGADVLRFTERGVSLPGIVETSRDRDVVMAISTSGDVISASTSTSGVALRRVNPTTGLVYERLVSLPSSYPAVTGVVQAAGDNSLWVYSASAKSSSTSLTGFVADLVSPEGDLLWRLNRPANQVVSPVGFGFEVYDVASNGTDVAVVGAFADALVRGSLPDHTIAFGAGWIEVLRP